MRFLFALIIMLVAQPVMAKQPLPAGDPQETRYRTLLSRWYTAQPPAITAPVVLQAGEGELDPNLKVPIGTVKRWDDLTPQQKALARKGHGQPHRAPESPPK